MTLYNWGIIGLGTIATEFAKSFKHEDSKLLGAASRSQEKAQEFATLFDIPRAYGNYSDMLADDDIDVVYIATPHNHHIKTILEALENGKHVLCEKAITLNQSELIQGKELAEQKGLILAEAMTIFNMPLYKELLERIQQDEFGKLKMIQASFGSYKEPDPTNRFFNPDLAGGGILDIGTYALSFVRTFLSSQPTFISSTMLPYETGVDEQSVTILSNKQDEMATVALTFQAKMPKQGIVALEKAFITVMDYPRADTATITYTNGKTELLQVGKSEEALNYEIANMIAMIKGELPNSSLELTNDVLQLMDEMRRQW